MLAIKLSQRGKTNKRMFRLVISEKSRDPYGNVLETLGSYNPHSKELVVKAERVKHWISKGAQMTPSVNNLLLEKKVIEGDKVSASKKGKKSEKRASQLAAKAEKNKKSAEAPAPEVKEAPTTEEVAAEEVKTEEAPKEEEKEVEKAE